MTLIARWKMSEKTIGMCEKLEKKLCDMLRFYLLLEKNLLLWYGINIFHKK